MLNIRYECNKSKEARIDDDKWDKPIAALWDEKINEVILFLILYIFLMKLYMYRLMMQ